MIEQSEQAKCLSITMSGRNYSGSPNKFTYPARLEIGYVFAEAAAASDTRSTKVRLLHVHLRLCELDCSKLPYISSVSSVNGSATMATELKWIVAKEVDEQAVRMSMGKPMLGLLLGAFKTFEIPETAFMKSLASHPGWGEVIESVSRSEVEYYASFASLIPISMDEEAFWALIERSKPASPSNHEQQKRMCAELLKLPADDIAEFDVIFRSKMDKLYRYDLWAIGYIINGGCSDDGFTVFRAWLICQGRDFYNQAIVRPEFVGEQVPVEAADRHALNRASYGFDLVAAGVYEDKIGYELYVDYSSAPEEPIGKSWDWEELPFLYPSIYRKFQ